ncbi:MAG: metalloregulator ArsR/SmtB family transcription factor [Methanobacteriaceae archaeon]|jgi:DNA-binding transcriptional ArsR family regulator|nr:metalloregulator ArsR/SmtB family transcription factor [Methanobacteriaceae archaeon]
MLRINSECSCDISEELEELFKALANVNRIMLLYSLASGEIESVNVTQMARMMGLTQPAASQHLKVLRTARILDAEKQGNQTYYTFNQSALVKHKQKIDFLFGCVLTKCNYLEEKE